MSRRSMVGRVRRALHLLRRGGNPTSRGDPETAGGRLPQFKSSTTSPFLHLRQKKNAHPPIPCWRGVWGVTYVSRGKKWPHLEEDENMFVLRAGVSG